jgi:hypothetical protein
MSIFLFMSDSFLKLGVSKFGAYVLIIIISSWWIIPFINI